MRKAFEKWVNKRCMKIHPWPLCERSGEGYLDLYTDVRWTAWKACWKLRNKF